MSDYIKNPLTEQHCRDLDQVLQSVPGLRATLTALESCGLDCQQQRELLEAQYNICSAIKAKFNPLAP